MQMLPVSACHRCLQSKRSVLCTLLFHGMKKATAWWAVAFDSEAAALCRSRRGTGIRVSAFLAVHGAGQVGHQTGVLQGHVPGAFIFSSRGGCVAQAQARRSDTRLRRTEDMLSAQPASASTHSGMPTSRAEPSPADEMRPAGPSRPPGARQRKMCGTAHGGSRFLDRAVFGGQGNLPGTGVHDTVRVVDEIAHGSKTLGTPLLAKCWAMEEL
jgi:hypothetical protein